MLTVKEFRSQYQLSESQFKRYRAIADERSGSPTCQRQGSNTWIVVNPDAILAVIPESVKNPSVVQETSAIIPSTRSFLASIEPDDFEIMPTLKHVSSTERVSSQEAALDNLLAKSSNYQNSIVEQLLNQAVADGEEIGTLTARVKIAAAKRKENELLENYAKKQGLEAVDA